MKVHRIKELIKECLAESVHEMMSQMSSADPSKSAIEKLKQIYNKYESFIPDVITYQKNPADGGKTFIIVAREVEEKQYVRLSVGLPEEDAKAAIPAIRDFHIKTIEANLRSGKYKMKPEIQRNAAQSLGILKSGQPSGDTGMVYKGKVNEMRHFPDLNAQYYASQNLKVPKLSTKYKIFYRHHSGFYLQGSADNADTFDHHVFIIRNRIGTMNQVNFSVYTEPALTPKDLSEVETWSEKEEVKQRREFERTNFPIEQFPRDYRSKSD